MGEVARLRDVEREEQEALVAASSELERVEHEDVAAMAESFKSGTAPKARTAEVEKAKAVVHERERRLAAARQAVSDAEADLGAQVVAGRDEWKSHIDKDVERVKESARVHLARVQDDLQKLAELHAVASWLEDGLDLARAAKVRGMGYAPSSRHAAANAAPFDAGQLVGWLREVLDPPPPRTEPVEHAPLVAPVEAA